MIKLGGNTDSGNVYYYSVKNDEDQDIQNNNFASCHQELLG
jgi:hypothetical protein